MQILIKVLINVHLLVNELCEYQNGRSNDKKIYRYLFKKKLNVPYTEFCGKIGVVTRNNTK